MYTFCAVWTLAVKGYGSDDVYIQTNTDMETKWLLFFPKSNIKQKYHGTALSSSIKGKNQFK